MGPLMKKLKKWDRDVAEALGAKRRKGRRPTVSKVAGDAISEATGCSKKTGMDVFHFAIGAALFKGLL